MLRSAYLLLASLAMLAPMSGAMGADLSLMPVAVHLDRTHDRTTVQVANNGSTAIVLQADAIAWRREAGVDRDEASSDLIVNPAVFTIAPGRTQIVRVGLRRTTASEQEATYRMVLREVPTPETAETPAVQGNVRVLVTMRLPVYVAPAAVRREERWHARYDEQGRLVAQVTNNGNVHYKVGAVRIQGEDVRTTVVAQGPDSVLFPGEVRSFRLPARNTPDQPLTLEVMTDRGVQYVALDLPPH